VPIGEHLERALAVRPPKLAAPAGQLLAEMSEQGERAFAAKLKSRTVKLFSRRNWKTSA